MYTNKNLSHSKNIIKQISNKRSSREENFSKVKNDCESIMENAITNKTSLKTLKPLQKVKEKET